MNPSDIGITVKTTGVQINEGMDQGDVTFPVYPITEPYRVEIFENYFCFPIHINYTLIRSNKFKLLLSAGPEFCVNTYNHFFNPNWVGEVQRISGIRLSGGMELGLVQWVKITPNVGLFSSQYFDFLFIGGLSNMQFLNLNIGFTYGLGNGTLN